MGIPIVLEEIHRNDREKVRLEMNTCAGEQVLCLRKYWSPDGGETWVPTRSGVNMHLRNWRKILPAITGALREDTRE